MRTHFGERVPILERVCRCGYAGPHTTRPGRPPHGEEAHCGGCDRSLGYLPKPQNLTRRPTNTGHRAYWRELMHGVLRCAICSRREGQGYPVAFDIDHIWPVEDGGPEHDARFTIPMCRDCHGIKNLIRAAWRHALGLSARADEREAA